MFADIRCLNFPSYATLTKATASFADMGARTISATVQIDGKIAPDFTYSWEIEFRGERFCTEVRDPHASKLNTNTYSEVELVFYHKAQYELQRYFFCTTAQTPAGTAMADKYEASVSLTLGDFVTEFNNVLNLYFGDEISMELNPGWSFDASPTFVEISYSYLWDVLQKMYELYAVRWTIDMVDGKYVIKVGYENTDSDLILQYGFEGGLLKYEQTPSDDTIKNILLGRGGDKNLPRRYFKEQEEENQGFEADPDAIPELQNIYFDKLRDYNFRLYVQGWKDKTNGSARRYAAGSYWAYDYGYTDTKFDYVEYVKDDASIQKYGERWGAVSDFEDIYPTIQGIGDDTTGWGIGRVDEVVAVEQILSDDVEGAVDYDTEIKNIDDITSTTECPYTTNSNGDKDGYVFDQWHTITAKSKVFSIPKNKMGVLSWDATLSAYAEIWAAKVAVTQDKNGNLTTQVTQYYDRTVNYKEALVILEDVSVIIKDAQTGENYTAANLPGGEDGRKFYVQFNAKYKILEDSTLAVNPPSKLMINFCISSLKALITDDEYERRWQNSFCVWIKDIWHSTRNAGETDTAFANRIWKPILGGGDGETATLVFSSGFLSTSEDYEFPIVEVKYDNSKTFYNATDKKTYRSMWKLRLAKCDADLESLGVYIPSVARQGSAGDYFFFTGIDMPHLYVIWAEKRLNQAKQDLLGDAADPASTKAVTVHKFFDEIMNVNVGDIVRITDPRFNTVKTLAGDIVEALPQSQYITAITYNYKNSDMYPDVDITLSNDVVVNKNPISTLSADVSAIQKQIGSISNIEQVVRVVGDSIYLRKDGFSDISISPTQFAALVTSKNFRQGGVTGTGWGFYRDNNGASVLEIDNLVLRQSLSVSNFEIRQVGYVEGATIESAAGMTCTEVVFNGDINVDGTRGTGLFTCYFDRKQGTVSNLFREDDIAFCRRFDSENNILKTYKYRVVGIGDDYIVLSNAEGNTSGNGEPTEGDVIIQYGNYTDKNRQYVKVRDVVGGGYERFIEGLDSVFAEGTEYYFAGKEIHSDGSISSYRLLIGNKDSGGDYLEWKDNKLTISGEVVILGSDNNKTTVQNYVDNQVAILQEQIDNVVESWNGDGEPAINSYPSDAWTTENEKRKHIGDVYIDNETGYAYRWYWNSNVDFGWVQISDTAATEALSLAKQSVLSVDVLFQSNTSETVAPALPEGSDMKGWQTDSPTWEAGKYIWTTTQTKYGDGETLYSTPVMISGKNGVDGTSITIVSTEIVYVASTSGKITPTSGWQSDVPTVAAGSYLWTRTTVTYSDNTSTVAYSVSRQGVNGTSVTITSTEVLYATSTTSTKPDDSAFTEEDVPTVAEGQYLWTRTTVTYSNGKPTVTYSVSRQGANGTSITITSQEVKYQTSANGSTAPSGTWYPAVQTTTDSKPFLWTRTVVTYSDGSSTTAYSVSYKGKDGTSPYLLDLTDEVVNVPCSSTGSPSITLSTVTTDIFVYEGNAVADGWTISKTDSGCTTTLDSNTLTLNTLTSDTAQVVVTATKGDRTLTATWKINKVKAGATGSSAVIYEITPSVNSISKYANGKLSASSITATRYRISGSTRSVTTSGYFTYKREGEDTDEIVISSSSTTIEITDNTTAVQLSLYTSSSKTTLYDSERIPVIQNGASQGSNLLYQTALNPDKIDKWTIATAASYMEDALNGQYAISLTNTSASSFKTIAVQEVYNPAEGGTPKILQPSMWYTCSFWTKGSQITWLMQPTVGVDLSAGIYIDGEYSSGIASATAVFALTDEWSYHTITFKTPATLTSTYHIFMGWRIPASANATLCMPKLELGTQATDWQVHESEKEGTSVTITSAITEYAPLTDSSTQPDDSEFTLVDVPTLESGKYLWSRTMVTYSDGEETKSYAVSYIGANGRSIVQVKEYYKLGTSKDTAPTGTYITSLQTPTKDEPYLWNYEKITYSDTTTSSTDKRVISTYGNGVKNITEYYLISASDTGITTSETDWAVIPQTPTSEKPYLWNYEETEYVDGTVINSTPHVVGARGENGRSIVQVKEYYKLSSLKSGITNTSSGFSTPTTAPTPTKNLPYLWNYEEIIYSEGESTKTLARIISTYGNGVKSITEYYLVSSASTGITTSTAGWSETPPIPTDNAPYLWNYEKTSYVDGTSSNSTPRVIGTKGASQGSNLLYQTALNPDKIDKWAIATAASYIEAALNGQYAISLNNTSASSTVTMAAQTVNSVQNPTPKTLQPSTWYTCSFWAKGSRVTWLLSSNGVDTSAGVYVDGELQDSPTVNATAPFDLVDEWSYHTISFKTSATVQSRYQAVQWLVAAGKAATLCMPKLELGTQATDWQVHESEKEGTGVVSVSEQYATSTSPTTEPSEEDWSSDAPSWVAGTYIWTRTVVEYTDGRIEYGDAICVTGNRGEQGESGSSPVIMDISDENITIPCDADGTPLVSLSSYAPKVTIYKGTQDVTSSYTFIMTGNGVTGSINLSTGVVTITSVNSSTNPGYLRIRAIPKNASISGLPQLTSDITFSYVCDGYSPTVFSLQPSVNNITRDFEGNLSSESITCEVYETGKDGRVLITDYNDAYISVKYMCIGDDEGLYDYYEGDEIPISSTTEAVMLYLYNGYNNTLLDQERIPVLDDASGFEIGGVNLALGTQRAVTIDEDTLDASATYQADAYQVENEGLAAGDIVTLSFLFTAHNIQLGGSSATINLTWLGKTTSTNYNILNKSSLGVTPIQNSSPQVYGVTDISRRFKFKVKLTSGNIPNSFKLAYDNCGKLTINPSTNIAIENPDSFMRISDFMLERGNVATTWSPNPHDMDYLTVALQENTKERGGLIQTSMMQVGQTGDEGFQVNAGMNGIVLKGEPGNGVAFWAGGDIIDPKNNPETAATFGVRMDGTVWAASNTVRIDKEKMDVGEHFTLKEDGITMTSDQEEVLTIKNIGLDDSYDIIAGSAVEIDGGFGPSNLYWKVENDEIKIRNQYIITKNIGTSNAKILQGSTISVRIVAADVDFEGSLESPRTAPTLNAQLYRFTPPATYIPVSSVYTVEPSYGKVLSAWNPSVEGSDSSSGSTSWGDMAQSPFVWKSECSWDVISMKVSAPEESIYSLRVWWGDSSKATNTSSDWTIKSSYTVTTKGKVTPLISTRKTLIGNNGLLSCWGSGALLMKSGVFSVIQGSYGLRVTDDGIEYTTNSGKNWNSLI